MDDKEKEKVEQIGQMFRKREAADIRERDKQRQEAIEKLEREAQEKKAKKYSKSSWKHNSL